MELVKKAWSVDLKKFDEWYLYSDIVCFAENRNKAKSKLLKEITDIYYGMRFAYKDDEVTYLNIPIKRDKQYDRYKVGDKELTKYQIEALEVEATRQAELDKLLADESISYCYIRKGDYYRPNWSGYTSNKLNAGVYSKAEAVSHARGVSEIRLVPLSIEEHNKMIWDEIVSLSSKIIQNE